MAGHSKWANIKHKKAKTDAKRGKEFSRVAKEIITAVKCGGSDPKMNPRLRLAIQKARSVNFPSDNIERNIKKAESQDQADFQEITYEVYGKNGVGILVEVLTDNKNRSASDVRGIVSKTKASIASIGSVAFQYDKKGIIQVQEEVIGDLDLFSVAIEAGAEDYEALEGTVFITTAPEDLYAVKEALDARGIEVTECELVQIPKTIVECDVETFEKNQILIDKLDDLDDVQSVYHNQELGE
jgi:YebC/PmpR family DNA-binding regulatory protein